MRILAVALCTFAICGTVGCSGKLAPAPDPKAAQPAAKSTPPATPSPQDKDLFEQNCSKCHPTARAADYKGSDPWKAIVDRMINKNKAQIAPDNATKIVAYLEYTFPKKSPG
jgi:hypothetical protein